MFGALQETDFVSVVETVDELADLLPMGHGDTKNWYEHIRKTLQIFSDLLNYK